MTDEGENRNVLQLLSSVVEMQQNVNATLRTVGDRYDRVQADIDRLPRLIGRLDESLTVRISQFEENLTVAVKAVGTRLDAVEERLNAIEKRLDAVVSRLEELERVVDRGMVEAREMRSDLVGQSNEILNALQVGLFARADLDDALGRIGKIERKIGL